MADAVLAPKVDGTRVLARAFQHRGLDFVVLCSSTTSILGLVGQVDYCGANAYLDAFASHHAFGRDTLVVADQLERMARRRDGGRHSQAARRHRRRRRHDAPGRFVERRRHRSVQAGAGGASVEPDRGVAPRPWLVARGRADRGKTRLWPARTTSQEASDRGRRLSRRPRSNHCIRDRRFRASSSHRATRSRTGFAPCGRK